MFPDKEFFAGMWSNYSKIGVFFWQSIWFIHDCRHCTGRIWKQNNRRTFWICVWGKHGQESDIVIVKPSFSKTQLLACLKNSSSMRSVLENWALFSWRINVFSQEKMRWVPHGLLVQSNLFAVVWMLYHSSIPSCIHSFKVIHLLITCSKSGWIASSIA